MRQVHAMPFGGALLAAGGARFALWAPGVPTVQLVLGADADAAGRPMTKTADGWHRLDVAEARAGDAYRLRMADGLVVPDPASRHNPGDVHGPSVLVDPRAYDWRHGGWRGRPWHEAVVYELHVGTFTREGTFAAAARRLADLVALGVTAVELMPLADFPGRRNWGYDGVLHFAPDAAYGTPDELKALVDAAHGLGLMTLVDVVYNHFGPEGNYLHAYCPEFFNPAHQTPWGAAINFDGPEARTVRDFYIHNALYWVEEMGFDGLRMDAIHAIRDDSPKHIVVEIAEALRAGPGRERHVHVVLENELNQASLLGRDGGGPLAGTAQWNDDLHHAAHVLVTGESEGYYADYAAAPLADFGRALAEGFVYQGQASAFHGGERRGEPSTALAPSAFVSALQTHDQVGNRAFGERIGAVADGQRLEAAYACLLLSPHVPMLFMGEEFAASTPFLYFCDFGPELAAAVTQGRRGEFGRFAAFADPAVRERIPDPNAVSTFEASRLRWDEREVPPHAARLALLTELLALRRTHLVPRLAGLAHGGRYQVEGDWLRVDWTLGDGSRWHLCAHFGRRAGAAEAVPAGAIVYRRGMVDAPQGLRAEPGAVCVSHEVGGG